MLTSNYLIINRQAQPFAEIRMAGKTAIFLDASGAVLNSGTLNIGEGIYAALFCDEVQNVTLVINHDGVQTVETILWQTSAAYLAGKKQLGELLAENDVRMSNQNKKLNRYAEEIAKKLADGVELIVIDAKKESELVECPECGMQSPKGTPYCMDCGAELPQ